MRRGLRIAVGAVLALAVAFAVVAGAFLWGVPISGEFLRAPLERALTAAFGMPTQIEGPLRLRTGLSPTAAADALVIADPSGPPGATVARGTRPAVRIDLLALARRVVALDEITGERLELDLARSADGRANWAPIFASNPGGGPPPVTFSGIARLRIQEVAGSYRSAGAAPVRFTIAGFDGALPLHDPAAARGTATIAGYSVGFDLRTASLAGLDAFVPIPVQGTLTWSGARLAMDGKLAADGARFDVAADLTAEDADPLLAALGIAARTAGRLEAKGRIGVTANDLTMSGFALTLGKSAVSGSGRFAWGAPRRLLAIDLTGERLDLEPFRSAPPSAKDQTAAEAVVELLEALVAGADTEVRIAAAELAGLPVEVRDARLEGKVGDRVVAMRGNASVAGTRTTATLDYDARKPQRVLAARLDGGAVSTDKLPGGERLGALSGTTGGIRGELRGRGESPRAIVASLEGSLDARDLRWTVVGRDGKPVSGRFDSARVALQGTRASSASITGRLGNATCAGRASGGALAPLLDGKEWPVQVAGSCGGAGRLDAKGRIRLAEHHLAADLAFDTAAARIGPVAQVLGVSPDAPHPFAARGTLLLDERLARTRLDAFRLGRTAGSGEIAFPLDAKGAPRVQLALTNVNVEELNGLGEARPVPSDPLDREVLRENLRLPDADFDIAADRVDLPGGVLRRLHLSGAMRASKLPPTRFGFDWEGAQVTGELGADFSGTAPRVQLDGRAQNADLGVLFAQLGLADMKLHAGILSLRARAEGVRLGELLAGATLDASLERGRLDLPRAPAPGLSGQADFSATLKAAPGQPAALAARGTLGGEPFDLTVDTPGLAGLARAGTAIPATLRTTLGDARLEATGKIARDGTGDGSLQLSGGRLDRLGRLAGVTLPEVGPYAASGTVVVATDAIRASDVDVSFGKSQLRGEVQLEVRRTGRGLHLAALRAPILHLEDIGAARWLAGPARPKEGEAPIAQREEEEIARALDLLRASDIDATLEIDALHGGAERFASGRLRATLRSGALAVELQDVRTASGSLDGDIRIDASGAQPKVAVRARVTDFEYGPLARTVDPATTMSGRLDLVADLGAQGPPTKLLPALAGTADLAVYPRGLDSTALDYWGTGLLRSMLRILDPGARSEVECAVTSLDVGSGVASTRALFVDTTSVRIIGQVDVNLLTRGLAGQLTPQSERPELVTVAPTLVLGGTLDDPRVTIPPQNFVLAPLRFATPLAGFALDWLSARGRLREGVAGCREAFERARKLRSAGPGGG